MKQIDPKRLAEKLKNRNLEIMDALASIPIQDVVEQITYLLNATKHVNLGREEGVRVEPDNSVRLRMVETILEHGAGAAGRRKPVETPIEEVEVAAVPTGSLRPAAKAIQPPAKTANT